MVWSTFFGLASSDHNSHIRILRAWIEPKMEKIKLTDTGQADMTAKSTLVGPSIRLDKYSKS